MKKKAKLQPSKGKLVVKEMEYAKPPVQKPKGKC